MSAKHQLMIKVLADSIASASNLRDIQFKDIIKEVEDYLKTYLPADMDIRCPIRAGNPTDTINYPTTTNVVPNVDENLPQLLDSRGGSHVTNVPKFDEEDFSSWKDSAKAIWTDLILTHEEHSETKDTKIAALRLKFNAFKALKGEKVNGTFTRLRSLLNDLENNGVSIPQAEVNATFVNSLPRKWLRHFQKECPSLKTSTPSYPSSSKTFNKPKFHTNTTPQSNQNINNNQKDYRVKYKGLKAEIAVLTKKIDVMSKGKSKKGLVAESFDWDEESVSSDDEGVTTFKALMVVADEPSVGRADARKHVLDYTHVDLHYVENHRKNLLSKYNSLKQELSSCQSELNDLKNTKALNNSFQNEITKLGLENESLKDEISDLKRVIEKWTTCRFTLDQLLIDYVPGNIVKGIGGNGKRKEKGSSKEIIFTKSDVSTSETIFVLPSDLESDDNTQRPMSSLPKLIGAEPSGVTKCLTIIKPKQPTNNVVPLTVKLRTETKPTPDSSTEKLLLTLMKEVKGLKEQIQTHSETSTPTSQSQSSKSAKGKDKIWYGPCKYCGLKNHLSEDCYEKPKCSTCGSSDHLTKEHPEQVVVKRTLAKLHAQPSQGSSRKAPMIPNLHIPCKYCGFNNHHSDECEFYPGCDLCSSIAHETSDCDKRNAQRKPKDYLKRYVWYLDSGCSRHMTMVKQYLHRYSKESGPKVVFGDNSSGDIEGYGSVNCNGITFTRVAYVNGLKHKLISISQLCDANFKVLFTKTQGTIFNQNQKVVLIAPRRRDFYIIDMTSYNEESNARFFSRASPSVNWLWHKILSHLNFKNINKLAKQNLVAGLPSLTFSKDKTCSACEKGKHHRASFKTKRSFSINKCLRLLYMDLFGLVKPQTISHNKYTLVIVDEYSRYTWVFCLKKKSDVADCIISFIKRMENLNDVNVKELRSDNGTEFKNYKLGEFCDEKAARTMLNSANLPKQFWGEAVNTACYTQNRSIIVKRYRKIAYDVFRGRYPDISYFYVFGCPVHIRNHKDHLGKFDEKADDGFFLGYSPVAKALRVFNVRRQEMEETYHVTFSEDDEAISQISTEGDAINFNEIRSFPDDEFQEPMRKTTQEAADSHHVQDSVSPEEHDEPQHTNNDHTTKALPSPTIPSQSSDLPAPQDRWSRDRHIKLVNFIGEPLDGVTTRNRIRESEAASAHACLYVNFLSQIEPKRLIEALEEEGCIISMQEELNQFERNKVWTLVPLPNGKTIIGTKWIYRNKMDEYGIVIKNKARLVAQGYRQKERIDYDETFTPVARLEAIRIFLAYVAYMGFTVYQIDVKSAFLNGKISKEVYVQQQPRFESSEFPNHVCKLDKALYGLKQAPRSCFQIKQDFRGISICQEKYVKDLLKKFDLADSTSVKCPMLPPNNLGPDELGVSVNETVFRGIIGSLMYLTASRPDIQFSTCLGVRYQANPKESHLVDVKRIFRYLKGTPSLGLWYPKESSFDLKAYSDSDYAGCNLDRKSTLGGCQILGGKLVCWSAKKQKSVAMSSTKAEYVAAAGCCAQVLWIKSQLADYDVLYDKVPIFYDNTSAIAISNNRVLHSRTKHIDIRYHFIRDHILKGDIELHFVPNDLQLADIFTKPLAEPSFTRLVAELALVIQPSAIYNKYLRDFWYSAKVVDNSITFSLSNVERSLSFDSDTFASVIGLEYLKEYISLPDHEAVKDVIATLRLSYGNYLDLSSKDLAHSTPLRLRYFSPTWKVLMTYLVKCLGGNQGSHDQLNVNQQMITYGLCWGMDIDIAGILYDDVVSKLTAAGKKGREKNICYTRYMSLVMEHLLGKEYVNSNLTATKSYQITSATFKKPTVPEVPLTSHMRKVANLDEEPLRKQTLTPLEQENVVIEVHMDDDGTEFVDSELHLIGNITLESLNQTADESPFDTESEIKIVKSYKPVTANEESRFTSNESDAEEDSNLEYIPDDEIGSPSAFQVSDSDEESLSEPKLSKSEEKYANKVLDELADLQASADKPSDSLS
ncbi:retrovirus-related pol polyprotein from transposon TNT 1-94 [Tanacetum coccineum]